MSHGLTTSNSYYTGRLAAWHKLGKVRGEHATSDSLLAETPFQYTVFKSQLQDGLGRPVKAWGTFRWNYSDKLAGNKTAAEFLGPVGEDYTCVQHAEGFKTIDAIMQSVNGAHYETAGVLGNGERVWALADLGLGFNIGDDVHKNFVLFVTGHDGSMAHTYKLVDERVVCANTLAMALSEKGFKSSFRHTKNAQGRILDAREAMAALMGEGNTLKNRFELLASRKMTREAVTSIFDRLFPKQKTEAGEDRNTTRRENIIADILRVYEANDGNAFPEQRGTAYNLLQGVTGYVDHVRGQRDGRAESAMFGSGDALKSKAFEVIMQAAPGLPEIARKMTFVSGEGSTGSSLLDSLVEASV